MRDDPVFQRYVNGRRRFYERLQAIRAQVDAWIERYAEQDPSVRELAQLEALHHERASVLADLQQVEDDFLNHVVMLKSGLERTPS